MLAQKMNINHNVDFTGEADNNEPQLNLALEKSISGCWAMNLQRQKMSVRNKMWSEKQQEVRLWSEILFVTPHSTSVFI